MSDLIRVVSFGYLYTSRSNADLTFDVRGRFADPYHDPDLRRLSGLHPSVFASLHQDPRATAFIEKVAELAMLLAQDGPGTMSLIVAFGDQSGHHLSVVLARMLVSHIRQCGYTAHATHLDLLKSLPPHDAIRDVIS